MALSEIQDRMDQFIDEGEAQSIDGKDNSPKEDIEESVDNIVQERPNSMSSVFQTTGEYRM